MPATPVTEHAATEACLKASKVASCPSVAANSSKSASVSANLASPSSVSVPSVSAPSASDPSVHGCQSDALTSSENPLPCRLRLTSARIVSNNLCLVEGSISGRRAVFLVDSGASASYVDTEWLQLSGLKHAAKISPDSVALADGTSVVSDALLPQARIHIGTYKDRLSFHATRLSGFDAVLGKDWLDRLSPKADFKSNTFVFQHAGKRHTIRGNPKLLLQKPLPDGSLHPLILSFSELRRATHQRLHMMLACVREAKPDADASKPSVDVSSLLSQFSDIFPSDLPGMPVDRHIQHDIELEPGHSPPNRPVIRMTAEQLQGLQEILQDFLDKGFIKPSVSPYGAPVLLIKKPDGSWRFVVDYRALNQITIKNVYPLPRIDDLLHQLHGATIFSKIDLKSGYYQVKVNPQHTHFTAFRTRYGSYEWTVLPMGLCNAPATFQRLMNDVFRQHLDKFVLVYLDDLLIYSRTPEEHLQHLESVFRLLREHKLFAHPKKCSFAQTQIEFLGHIVSKDGIAVDPKKVKAISEWPTPRSVSDLRQFMGAANYLRKHVEKFAHITAPLTALMTNDNERNKHFPWTAQQDAAFQAIKDALCNAPVIVTPDLSAPFHVRTDASRFAIGAVLTQPHGVIAYESRKLTPAERNYPVHEQELLAVVHAFRVWKHLLQGAKHRFRVTTDNTPTRHVFTAKDLTPRQLRWAEFLAEFNFEIDYAPGKTNVVADALSRRPDLILTAISALSAPDLFAELVREAGEHDSEYASTLQSVRDGTAKPGFSEDNGLLYFKDTKGSRLYIPAGTLRTILLCEAHDSAVSGHLGRDKTLARLTPQYFWPKMDESIRAYIKTCPECQRNKASSQRKPGRLQPLPVPKRNWESISMDFIVQLPKTKSGHDAIFVIVDRLSKMAHFVPTTTTASAEDTAELFFSEIFRIHGIPSSIISDRDSKFTSKFWSALFQLSGTALKLSTANHPQTDGQTERMNRTLEEMLRAYVGPFHNDWDERLVACEFAYNSAKQASTGFSPFYLNYGFEPPSPLSFLTPGVSASNNASADKYLDRIRNASDLAKSNLAAAQARQAALYDKRRRDLTFRVGDKVLLSAEHFSNLPAVSATAAAKLKPKYFGPFSIKAVVSPVAYMLDLPAAMRMHPVVHVSRLQPWYESISAFRGRPKPSEPPPPEIHSDDDVRYHVESFRAHRNPGAALEYLVKWVGYPDHENTWVRAFGLRADLGVTEFNRLVKSYNSEVSHRNKQPKRRLRVMILSPA